MTALPLLCFALAAHQDAPLVHSTFAGGEDGWIAAQPAGSGAMVSAVHDSGHLKIGTGSLRLGYTVGQGQIAAAALPISDGAAAKLASIAFWVRADQDTPMVLALQEKGGGRYTATFATAKDRWQEVVLHPRDFVLNEGAGDPVDPDGRLDPETIESVSILDLDQMVFQDAKMAGVLGVKAGTRAVYLSDFKITDGPPDSAAEGPEFVFDAYAGPQVNWGVMNAAPSLVTEPPLNARALRLDYNLPSSKAAAAFKRIRKGALAGKSSLSIRLAAKSACQVVVQLEEAGGGKYDATLSVLATEEGIDRTIPFSELKAAEDSKDPHGKLVPGQVTQVTVIDVTAMTDAPGRNTLWIGRIAAKP